MRLSKRLCAGNFEKLSAFLALISGVLLPPNLERLTELAMVEFTNQALGKRFSILWKGITSPLVALPDSLVSIHFSTFAISSIPRSFHSFPSKLTSLTLKMSEITPSDFSPSRLPPSLKSLHLRYESLPELSEWFWAQLPRGLEEISLLHVEPSKPKNAWGGTSGVNFGATIARDPSSRTPGNIASSIHTLIGIPQSLKKLDIPVLALTKAALTFLGTSLTTLNVWLFADCSEQWAAQHSPNIHITWALSQRLRQCFSDEIPISQMMLPIAAEYTYQ